MKLILWQLCGVSEAGSGCGFREKFNYGSLVVRGRGVMLRVQGGVSAA
jgi:hypothetical protein